MNYKVKVVKNGKGNFPGRLKRIKPTVESIFYKGAFDDNLFEKCLAVVGTRRITEYGRQVTEKIVYEAVAAGITIVSGFMFGVDAVSHKAAVDAGGRTIAVMPCGIETITPSYQEKLYFEILKSDGCVMSEIEGKTGPKSWTFARRNRIVAGLSQAVLVVEGTERSGSLITAEFAKKYGREVFAVPGPITSRMSEAPNKLIKEGAKLVSSSEDILKLYQLGGVGNPHVGKRYEKRGNKEGAGLENKILDILISESMSADDIAKKVLVKFEELNSILIKMELAGKIKEKSGKYYVN